MQVWKFRKGGLTNIMERGCKRYMLYVQICVPKRFFSSVFLTKWTKGGPGPYWPLPLTLEASKKK